MFLGSFFSCNMSLDPTPVDCDVINELSVENGIYDDVFVDTDTTREITDTIPEWDYSTLLHAEFHDNILAGNVEFAIDTISSLVVKKRQKGTFQWIKILEVTIEDDESFNFLYNDYIVASKTQYEYAAIPILNGAEGTYQPVSVDVSFDGAFILDSTGCYPLVLNLARGDLTRAIHSNILEPVNSKYPFVNYYAATNYDKFSLSGLFVQKNSDLCEFDFENGWAYRKTIRDFLNNKRTKVVKLYNGEIYMAAVTDSISETIDGHPDNVKTTMHFAEVGDVNDASDLYYHGFTEYLEAGV